MNQPRVPAGGPKGGQWTSLASKGFHLQSWHKNWLRENLVELKEVSVENLVPTEQGDVFPTPKTHPHKLGGILTDWKQGYRVPVPEVFHRSDGKLSVSDGHHRIGAQIARGRKTIPVIVSKK